MNEQLDRMEMKLAILEGKITEVYESSEKMRKYFLWAFFITLGAIALPLLILPFLFPVFLSAVSLPTGF